MHQAEWNFAVLIVVEATHFPHPFTNERSIKIYVFFFLGIYWWEVVSPELMQVAQLSLATLMDSLTTLRE